MTPAEYTAALATLSWSGKQLADKLACDTNLPTRWSRGTAAVPPVVAVWLAALSGEVGRALKRHPTPVAWRRRPV
jgi:hypothetical protein